MTRPSGGKTRNRLTASALLLTGLLGLLTACGQNLFLGGEKSTTGIVDVGDPGEARPRQKRPVAKVVLSFTEKGQGYPDALQSLNLRVIGIRFYGVQDGESTPRSHVARLEFPRTIRVGAKVASSDVVDVSLPPGKYDSVHALLEPTEPAYVQLGDGSFRRVVLPRNEATESVSPGSCLIGGKTALQAQPGSSKHVKLVVRGLDHVKPVSGQAPQGCGSSTSEGSRHVLDPGLDLEVSEDGELGSGSPGGGEKTPVDSPLPNLDVPAAPVASPAPTAAALVDELGKFVTSAWATVWNLRGQLRGSPNTARIDEPGLGGALRVHLPKGATDYGRSVSQGEPLGGVDFFSALGLPPADSRVLKYKVRFPGDFDWRVLGEMPGLYGGALHDTAPGAARTSVSRNSGGFELRLGWGPQGQTRVLRRAGQGDLDEPTSNPGQFKRGVWQDVEIRVGLNTPNADNGTVTFLVDGVVVHTQSNLRLRTSTQLRVEGVNVLLGYHGTAPANYPVVDSFVDLADFTLQ